VYTVGYKYQSHASALYHLRARAQALFQAYAQNFLRGGPGALLLRYRLQAQHFPRCWPSANPPQCARATSMGRARTQTLLLGKPWAKAQQANYHKVPYLGAKYHSNPKGTNPKPKGHRVLNLWRTIITMLP
jgi:hypothetical protein